MKQLGIVDAGRLSISDSVAAGPDAESVMRGWFRKLVLGVVRQFTVDHKTKETVTWVETSGVIVPLSARALEIKPEGSRTWDWRRILATPDLVLTTEDVVIINRGGKPTQFRVMRSLDYSQNGYVELEIVNDYVDRTNN